MMHEPPFPPCPGPPPPCPLLVRVGSGRAGSGRVGRCRVGLGLLRLGRWTLQTSSGSGQTCWRARRRLAVEPRVFPPPPRDGAGRVAEIALVNTKANAYTTAAAAVGVDTESCTLVFCLHSSCSPFLADIKRSSFHQIEQSALHSFTKGAAKCITSSLTDSKPFFQ